MKSIASVLAASLLAIVLATSAQASGCGYPYLGIQIARAQESIGKCWSMQCWKASMALWRLQQKQTLTFDDVRAIDEFAKLSGQLENVGKVMTHIILDHEGSVLKHNAVEVRKDV